jgi:hypothetical protein
LPAAPRSATPWVFFTPYWEYCTESLRQISSLKPADLDWSYSQLQEKFETFKSASRDFALFPRRAFSALDALMASFLRIDPQQAYTLSVWIHHLWLLHIAIVFSRLLRLKTVGLITAILLIVYWPNSHLAVAADNRDQANCLILVFVLFILARLHDCRFWPTITCLCALLVGYPELAIPALVAFYAQRYDAMPTVTMWLRQIGKELGTTLLCLWPLLPPALLGLMRQWSTGPNRGLVFPVQYAAPWAGLDYLPGWKLLWNDLSAISYVSLVLDILILLMAAGGLIVVFRKRQIGTLIGHGAVLAVGCLFLYRRDYYPAYKVLTILWPFFLWLLVLSLSRFSSPQFQPGFPPGRYRYAPAVLLIIFSLPAILSVAQIPFPGSHQLVGANHLLADRLPENIKAFFQPRMSDVNRLEQISRKVSKKKQKVLVIGDIPPGSPHDIGFAQLLLRKESVFFPQSSGGDGVAVWRYPPYPSARPASSHQPIDRVLLLNSTRTFDFHRAERHIFGGAFDEDAFRQMNFSADLQLKKREHLLMLCRSTAGSTAKTNAGNQTFLFENDELRVDIYHINAPSEEVGRLSFSITSPDSLPVKGRLEVLLDGKPIEAADGASSASEWSQTVFLSPEAMHQQLLIRIKREEPLSAASQWRFEMTNFESSAPGGVQKISDN